MLPLFIIAIFTGASLLFLVQPLIARVILPWMGGAPAVWNTAMVFFQGALLLGYLYAHALSRLADPRRQVIFHAAVLALACLTLPIGLPASEWWHPDPETPPALSVLLLLALSVGVPFFALASAGPLLQRWFARSSHPRAADPYFLYAASNAGSMLALLGYPLLVEPSLGLTDQRWWWSGAFLLAALLAVACGVAMLRRPGIAPAADPPTGSATEPASNEPRRQWTLRARWIALAAVPSSLMLGATQYLTSDIGSFPLLWVLPLSLYLLTWIIAFTRAGPLATHVAGVLMLPAAVGIGVLLITEPRQPIGWVILAHAGFLLLAAQACHGRLAARRPHPSRLTEFYLCLSIGGLLGGLFNAFAAPAIFTGVTEYPLAIAAACLLGAPSFHRSAPHDAAPDPSTAPPPARPAFFTRARLLNAGLAVLLPGLVAVSYMTIAHAQPPTDSWSPEWRRAVELGAPALICLSAAFWRVRFALCVLALALMPGVRMLSEGTPVLTSRTFFGVHRVFTAPDYAGPDLGMRPAIRLWHGRTDHGSQFLDPDLRGEPTTYYTRSGPAGDALRLLQRRHGPLRIALVGLGAGTMAAHLRPDDQATFFEIDPEVDRIANDTALFTYLRDARDRGARIHPTILGDARLTMARVPDGSFDLIVLDAFSSDAIPRHLLTVEALRMFARRLTPDGLLLVHISNWYLQLDPVLALAAADLGLTAYRRWDDRVPSDRSTSPGHARSDWVALAPRRRTIEPLLVEFEWETLPFAGDAGLLLLRRPWTDDHSDILSILRIRWR
jgi:SAM-dependent methyltransferase